MKPITEFRISPFRRDVPGNVFTRWLTARALAELLHDSVKGIAQDCWPSDHVLLDVVERASSAPAMVTVAGWAAELAHRIVSDAVEALGPASAAAQVLRRCLLLSFDGAGSISAPAFAGSAGNASFVADGNPIPVRQLSATTAILNPFVVATIAVLTREMMESSNAEALITDALVRSAAAAMDAVMFDANPADGTRPAGLKNGISTLTASSSTDPFGAMFEDIANLVNAVSLVGGSGPYVLVGSPGRVASAAFRMASEATAELIVFAASNAAGSDLYAIAPQALVAAISPAPAIELSRAAHLVMDTAPGAANTTGSNKSMFQTDSIAIKVRWPVSWALRDPRGFAWLTPSWK
jgi:hypothetical protein